MELATVVLVRGRLDEAVALRDQSATIIAAPPEPQAAGTLPLFDGYLALSRRDQAAASERFAEAADQVRAHNNVDGLPEIFADCARAFLLFGDRDRAETYRDLETSTDSIEAAVF